MAPQPGTVAQGPGMGVPIAPEVLEALEAVLPEDAPPGHEAWSKVKYRAIGNQGRSPCCHFTFGQDRFQATLSSCLTEQALLRVTRACYAKFLDGEPKERVAEFRDQIYARIKRVVAGGGDAPADPPRKKAKTLAATGAPPTASAGEVADVVASGSAPSRSPPAGSPPSEASRPAPAPAARGTALPAAAALADAPEGHEAWSRCNYQESGGLVRLHLKSLKLPCGDRYQTTVKACGGSVEDALRIARLCWVRFAEGASKEEVTAYRQSLYDAVAPPAQVGAPAGEPPARKAARAGAAASEAATLEAAKRELKAQGRLEGSLLVEGRSSERKNASINGLYARRAADHGGHGAYEKVGADAAVRPRFLYYWREKSRWKIDCRIPGEKSGFAYLKVAGIESPALAGPDCQWHVCDDKGEGYSKDPSVRCVEAVKRPRAAVPARRKAKHQATAAGALPSKGNSASDDSSSDDAGDQTSGDEESSSASGAESPARPGAAAQAPRRRACAKMMVRSGLRCVCHFRMLRDCPGRPQP